MQKEPVSKQHSDWFKTDKHKEKQQEMQQHNSR